MSNEVRKDDLLGSESITTADLAGVEKQSERTPEGTIEDVDSRSVVNRSPAVTPQAGSATAVATARAKMEEELGPLFSGEEANDLRSRWDRVQVAFVDEPRQAVEDADRLIATTMKRLAEIFADERQKLEHQWDRGDNVSTEDLRVALRRYRSFFSRLLKV